MIRIKINKTILTTLLVLYPTSVFAGGGHEHGNSKKEHAHDKDLNQEEEHDEHEEEEGIIHLTKEAITNANIEIRKVSNEDLATTLKVNGRVSPVSSSVAHLSSRFSGIIREVKKDIGDSVKPGEGLAIIESNQNLQRFEVRAQQAGVITDRHATVGESIKEDEALFIVMDLSQVWVDFTVFIEDFIKVKVGQAVKIYYSENSDPITANITFISPVVDETTQSKIVRVVIPNNENMLAPGTYVNGQIQVDKFQVPVAVTYDAIQTIENKPVVFVRNDHGFEKREIVIGRSDGMLVEVISGLKIGEKYASTNTFILKAELGKAEAEHEH